jgi:hypothetical protein
MMATMRLAQSIPSAIAGKRVRWRGMAAREGGVSEGQQSKSKSCCGGARAGATEGGAVRQAEVGADALDDIGIVNELDATHRALAPRTNQNVVSKTRLSNWAQGRRDCGVDSG